MSAATETLHVKAVMTTQDGVHIAWCKVGRDRTDAQVTTPKRMFVGDTLQAERIGRDWRFIQAATIEAAEQP